MRRFSPAMNVDHVPSCHFLFCEQYVALLYLDTPVGKLLDRVFPPINCFFRVTRREAKPEAHRNQPAKMGKNCIESTARIGPIIPCGYIRYVCYRSNQLAVRMQIHQGVSSLTDSAHSICPARLSSARRTFFPIGPPLIAPGHPVQRCIALTRITMTSITRQCFDATHLSAIGTDLQRPTLYVYTHFRRL